MPEKDNKLLLEKFAERMPSWKKRALYLQS